MHLGASGAGLDLQVAGYQFPARNLGREPLDAASWDANWLVINGSVRTTGDTGWSFCEPALTTWEAGDLATWLHQVADGAVAVAANLQDTQTDDSEELDFWEQLTHAGWVTFTEPNLSFAVANYAGPTVELLIGLSHESAEPPIDPLTPRRRQITVAPSRNEVHHAATDLQEQLATYPVR